MALPSGRCAILAVVAGLSAVGQTWADPVRSQRGAGPKSVDFDGTTKLSVALHRAWEGCSRVTIAMRVCRICNGAAKTTFISTGRHTAQSLEDKKRENLKIQFGSARPSIEHPYRAPQSNQRLDPRLGFPLLANRFFRETAMFVVAIPLAAWRACSSTVKLAPFLPGQSGFFARRSRPSARSASDARPFVSEIPTPRA